jgi:hypothetical protein
VNSIFDTLFTEFQPAPYVIPEPGRISRLDSIRMSGRAMLAKLDSLLQISRDTIEALRLRRIKAYIEFSSLYAETFQSGKKAGLEKLVNYSADHPDQDMVLMYPGYIRWRLEEYLNQ